MRIITRSGSAILPNIISQLGPIELNKSSAVVPDIIILDCIPSIAIILGNEETVTGINNLSSFLGRLRAMSEQFRYSFLIMIGFSDNDIWNYFQTLVDGDTIRLFQTNRYPEAALLIMRCCHVMSDKIKNKKQAEYFEVEKGKLCSSSTARTISRKALQGIKIPQEDIQLLMEGFPSIASLAKASYDEMQANSPAALSSIVLTAKFFGQYY